MRFRPELVERDADGVRVVSDPGARDRGVLVAFADRRGGVSRAPFGSLNLALKVGDDRADVEQNRRRVATAAGFDPSRLVLARQVHGTDVIEVTPSDRGVIGEADVLVARCPGPVIGVLTADCAPVVVAGAGGVTVIHAGWRGLIAGVVDEGVARVAPAWAAWVGPSIHACCYEVGREVIDAFSACGLPIAGNRVDPGRAAVVALRRAGVGEVAASDECTSCEARFFSYRRDALTGRQGAFVALLGDGR